MRRSTSSAASEHKADGVAGEQTAEARKVAVEIGFVKKNRFLVEASDVAFRHLQFLSFAQPMRALPSSSLTL